MQIKFVSRLLFATALGALALQLAGCGAEASAPAVAATPPPVQVATPVQRAVPVVRELPAHVEAIERVELRPRVSGYVTRIAFQEGALVKQGQLLVEIDPRPYRAALASAEANLAQAAAQSALAQREAERATRLVETGAIAREDAERRRAVAEVARAAVAAAEAAAERARIDLADTRLTAPFTGRMGRAEITRGNLVSSADRLGVLVRTDAVYLRFDLDAAALASAPAASAAWQARFTLPEQPGTPFEGRIAFLDNEVGARTGTLRVRARLSDPQGRLVPGRYGRVALTLGETPDALLVDDKALGTDQGQRFLLVVGADGVVQYRPVETGAAHGELRVIEAGLAAGDQVVVNGLMRVRPGMPVTPVAVPMDQVAGALMPSAVGGALAAKE